MTEMAPVPTGAELVAAESAPVPLVILKLETLSPLSLWARSALCVVPEGTQAFLEHVYPSASALGWNCSTPPNQMY